MFFFGALAGGSSGLLIDCVIEFNALSTQKYHDRRCSLPNFGGAARQSPLGWVPAYNILTISNDRGNTNKQQISQDSNALFKYYQLTEFLTCHSTTTLLHAFVDPLAFKLPIGILDSPNRRTHVTTYCALTGAELQLPRQPLPFSAHEHRLSSMSKHELYSDPWIIYSNTGTE